MQKPQGRKYQVVEEAEIDLVLKCRDSHEFYEQYLRVFPDTKKGLDSISKVWKRRSEFAKKRQLDPSAGRNRFSSLARDPGTDHRSDKDHE